MGRLRMKSMLLNGFASGLPAFAFIQVGKPGYWFKRAQHPNIGDFVVVGSSQKFNCFGVDVASTFFDRWDGRYGRRQMRRATPLPALRLATNAVPYEESLCFYDGTVVGAQAAIERICAEVREFGLPFFDAFASDASHDPLLSFGLEWLDRNRSSISVDIQIDEELREKSYLIRRIENETFVRLESDLRKHGEDVHAPIRLRQETQVLAFDLLSYYAENYCDEGGAI
jgi:hypothetical protein